MLRRVGPYLWHYRWRVAAALGFLVAAKVANVGVPVLLKHLVDALDLKAGDPRAILVVPIGLLLAYAALRLSTSVFTELRELIFAKASFGASKQIALEVFGHLHALEPALSSRAADRRPVTRHRARHARAAVAAAVFAVHASRPRWSR